MRKSLCVSISHPGHEASDGCCSVSGSMRNVEEPGPPALEHSGRSLMLTPSQSWVCLVALRTPVCWPQLAVELHGVTGGVLFSSLQAHQEEE